MQLASVEHQQEKTHPQCTDSKTALAEMGMRKQLLRPIRLQSDHAVSWNIKGCDSDNYYTAGS